MIRQPFLEPTFTEQGGHVIQRIEEVGGAGGHAPDPPIGAPEKERIYEVVLAQVEDYCRRRFIPLAQASAIFAILGTRHLASCGIAAHIQAGTMWWPRVPEEFIEKEASSYIGFEWKPEREKVSGSLLRAWAVLPATHEYVDFSTGQLVALARVVGLRWTGPRPPAFLWARREAWPKNVAYQSALPAIRTLLRFVVDEFGEKAARELVRPWDGPPPVGEGVHFITWEDVAPNRGHRGGDAK